MAPVKMIRAVHTEVKNVITHFVVFTVTHRDNKCFKTRSEVLMFEYSLPETFYDLNVILNNQLVLKYLLKSMFSLKTYHWDVLHVETTFDVNYF